MRHGSVGTAKDEDLDDFDADDYNPNSNKGPNPFVR